MFQELGPVGVQRELQSDVSGNQGSLETRVEGRCGFWVCMCKAILDGWVCGFSRELVSALADLYSPEVWSVSRKRAEQMHCLSVLGEHEVPQWKEDAMKSGDAFKSC